MLDFLFDQPLCSKCHSRMKWVNVIQGEKVWECSKCGGNNPAKKSNGRIVKG
jgi:ribosomal protein L37AE/L43A